MNKPLDPHRKALGRGLSTLLPPRTGGSPPTPEAPSQAEPGAAQQLPIDAIDPNPLQPRSVFQADRLRELADSIRANGIIQPLIVRKKGDRYELIAGERRWRAARMAEMAMVPVVVQDVADGKLLEVSLIENIQREDLNPIEVAHAYDRLAREHGLSHEEIGKRTGKDRPTITNMIRLLRLPPEVQLLLAEHRLSMGHARAILGLPTADLQRHLADKAAAEGLSVRQVERTVQKLTEPRESPDQVAEEEPKIDPNVRAAIEDLERTLGTRVRIVEKDRGRGRIEIDYFSEDDLDRIYQLITGEGK
ncbi:MAG: ParB/RepB/Spo0J family partition protein [Bryobacterales bacterium]|nr:ParB/RepB/Spo0J family partition protein [Bryobacterales bacterium]